MDQITYTLEQLVEETGFVKRNIRHYMKELNIVSQGTPGRNASYPKDVRDKLVFYSILKDMADYLTLTEVKRIFEELTADMIEQVADGNEPLEIADIRKATGVRGIEVKTKIGNEPHIVPVTFEGEQSKDDTKKGQTQFSRRREARGSTKVDEWKTIKLDDDIELRVRGDKATGMLRQLKLLGEFVKSILREEK